MLNRLLQKLTPTEYSPDPVTGSAGDPDSLRQAVRARVQQGFQSSTRVALESMMDDDHSPQAHVRQRASANVATFYQLRNFPKTNGAVVDLDNSPEQRWSAKEHTAALNRSVSFVAIANPMQDIGALTGTAPGQAGPRMSPKSKAVLGEVIRATHVHYVSIRAQALADARSGTRALPLTLDTKRFGSFLAKNDVTLTKIIHACRHANRKALLAPLLTNLATEYLRTSQRLPSGIRPASGGARGDAVRVTVGTAECSSGGVAGGPGENQVLIDIGNQTVSWPDPRNPVYLKEFDALPDDKKLAGQVLQTLFHILVSAEEELVAQRVQLQTNPKAEELRTLQESAYVGSDLLGDGCTDTGSGSQRDQIAWHLREFPEMMSNYEEAYGEPLVQEQELREWLESPQFPLAMQDITLPPIRMANAQLASTSELLLKTNAFRQ